MHFWQNGQDLLHATVVTWGWDGYQNKRKADDEEDSTSQIDTTFSSRAQHSTTELSTWKQRIMTAILTAVMYLWKEPKFSIQNKSIIFKCFTFFLSGHCVIIGCELWVYGDPVCL